MSNPFSWYPRYPRDYGEATAHLSLAEHGAYTLLLDHYMTSGGAMPIAMPIAMHLLPVCYRICRAQTDEERAAVESVVRQFFAMGDDNCLHNKRADIELQKRRNLSETRASVAKKGASKRWGKPEEMPIATAIAMPIAIANAMPEAMLQGIANGCTSTSTSTDKNKTPFNSPLQGDKQKKLSEPKARGSRLPSDWGAKESHHHLADQLGVVLYDEAVKFRDYWLAEGKTKVDWDRTFNNWLRTAAERKNRSNNWSRR